MHLFLLDLFVSLDTLAPIIKVIQKKIKSVSAMLTQ